MSLTMVRILRGPHPNPHNRHQADPDKRQAEHPAIAILAPIAHGCTCVLTMNTYQQRLAVLGSAQKVNGGLT